MKKFLLFSFALLVSICSMGQSIVNYGFTYSTTGNLEDMTVGATSLVGSGGIVAGYNDDNATALTTIPFSFYFMGVPYTQFSANSNGQVRLGSSVISGTAVSTLSSGVVTIAAMDGDNAVQGAMSYKIKNSAPNRILIIEWKSFTICFHLRGVGIDPKRKYFAKSVIEPVSAAPAGAEQPVVVEPAAEAAPQVDTEIAQADAENDELGLMKEEAEEKNKQGKHKNSSFLSKMLLGK